MNRGLLLALLAVFIAVVTAEVYLDESFEGSWDKRWITSDWKKAEGTQGKFKLTAGKWHGPTSPKGIQTAEDARFYAISAPLEKEFDTKDKTVVFQFTVKNEQKLDCGGGYLKLLPEFDAKNFNGDSAYALMFGPDICGYSTRRTHLIIPRDGKNHLVKREIKVETDQLTHVYTAIIRPDNTYEVLIDNQKVQEGSLYEDFDFLPPKQIPDPSASKPADWVDEKEITDPSDVKPEGYDDIPATIVDEDATKPDDWDDEEDGEWQPPQIANPAYKGPWKAKRIPNPAYKGEWKAPLIDNPDYEHVDKLFEPTIRAVGLEIWQVKAGSIFGNVLVTDDEEVAREAAERVWESNKDAEKKAFEAEEEKQRKKEDEERKRAEEERKRTEAAKKAATAEDDDEDDDDDDEPAASHSAGHAHDHDHDHDHDDL